MYLSKRSLSNGVKDLRPDIPEELERFRSIARYYGITEMLSAIASSHQFYDRLSEKDKANFDYLFEKCANTKYESIYAFRDSLTMDGEDKSSEAMSKGQDDDVVTVTTIHQSKGLQYGIVFIWSTSRNDFRDSSNAVMVDDNLMLGINHISMPWRLTRPTLRRMAIEYKQNIEDLEEFTRLLYVAVTRAKDRLFFVDVLKQMPDHMAPSLPLIAQRKGMSFLILSVLENQDLFKAYEAEIPPLTKAEAIESNTVDQLPRLSVQPEILPTLLMPSETEFTSLPDLEVTGNSERGRKYGTRMHEAVESLPNREWTEEDYYGLEISVMDYKKLQTFSDSDLYKKCLTMEIRKEMPFYVETPTERITGSMDFAAIGETEAIIIDFKTDACPKETLLERYSDQLNAYRRALQTLYPEKQITVYAWSFHEGSEILIPDPDGTPNTMLS